MTKNHKHNRRLRMHPIHFQVGAYVAVAAMLITAMKSSEGIITSVYPNSERPVNNLAETFMREAENHIGHAQMVQHRRTGIGGA